MSKQELQELINNLEPGFVAEIPSSVVVTAADMQGMIIPEGVKLMWLNPEEQDPEWRLLGAISR